MLSDDPAGGVQHLLLLRRQVQLNDLFYAVFSDAAGDAAVDAPLAVLPIQQGGDGEDPLLIPEDTSGQLGQGPADAELRGALALDNVHPRTAGLFQNLLLVQTQLFKGDAPHGDGGEGDHGGVAVLAHGECAHAPPVRPGLLADDPDQPGGVQEGPGAEAAPSLQLQALAQVVGHDVGGVGDGHHRTGEVQGPQFFGEALQQLHRPAQQVQPGLTREPGLPDGHHRQVGVLTLPVSPGADGDVPVQEADAVGHVQSLGGSLLRRHVHQHDLPAHPGGGQGVGAVTAHMPRSDDDDFSLFHFGILPFGK